MEFINNENEVSSSDDSEDELSMIIKCIAEDSDNDSSINSISDESSSEDEERRIVVKCENFVEKVVPRFEDRQFQEHFRLSRHTFEYIWSEVSKANIIPTYKPGRENVATEKVILITLWYLANQETYRQISDRFNVCQSTALECIRKMVKYLVNVSSTYIKWPPENQAHQISQNFENKQGIRGVVGAIDGTHISIRKPGTDQSAYCNRKGYHSILLQGVCDDQKRFINVFCGEAGSLHDARVLRHSALYRKTMAENGLPGDRFLLGDSAYPNLGWLVVPFKDNGHLTQQQKIFNYRHSSTRITVENSYGLLKGRFRRLKHFENLNINFIVNAVVASCVLHNICINMNDIIEVEPYDEDADRENEPEEYNYNEIEALQINRRQIIFNEMFNII